MTIEEALASRDKEEFVFYHKEGDFAEAAAVDAVEADSIKESVKDSLLTDIYARIKQEIETDPTGRGYAGKKDNEIADLLNAPVMVTVEDRIPGPSRLEFLRKLIGLENGTDLAGLRVLQTAIDEEYANDPAAMGYANLSQKDRDLLLQEPSVVVKTREVKEAPRVAVILSGIPFAPNVVEAADVTAALGA